MKELCGDGIQQKKGFTDIHQHLIFGVDDGPGTSRGSYNMLRMAKQEGISRIIATPHVIPGIKDFDIPLFRKRLWRIRAFCERWQIGVEVFPGSEILYT